MKAYRIRLLVLGCWLLGLLVAGTIPSHGQEKGKGKGKGVGKTGEPTAAPQVATAVPADLVKHLKWRCIGPANMGGRITALAVYEADPTLYYVATASGGLLKTTNNGTTFTHQFDTQATVSIGDVCVCQTDPNLVWIGTGENNPRNSVSYGDGVYKSTDGGKNWTNMGLKQTFQIGKILIHPKNPDIVYVGALGRLYGPNPERGVFKTTDGGKSWEKVFYLDENTGIIDMCMHPTDPETLIVAAWERKRDGFDSLLGGTAPSSADVYDPIKKWGPNAGIYRTRDGGKTFHKLSKGLPSGQFGRVGLDWYRKDPNIVYAIIDCEKIGMGTPPKKVIAAAGRPYLGLMGEDAGPGARITELLPDGPAEKAGLKEQDIIVAVGKKTIKTYDELLEEIDNLEVGDKVNLALSNDPKRKIVVVTLGERPQFGPKGGAIFGPGGPKKDRPYHAFYGGQSANQQDKQGKDGHEYGGVYKSTDGGESWTRVNSLNPRPMYFSQVRVDPTNDQNVYVLGIQQHKSTNGGQRFDANAGKGVHADGHALWINPKDGRHMLIGTDGGTYVSYDRAANWDHLNHLALGQFYHVAVCTKKPYWCYGGLQDNGCWGGPSVGLRGIGPINEDWVSINGGDGYVCRVDAHDPDLIYAESQDGGMMRRHLRTGESKSLRITRPKDEKQHRFNWNTPYILSSHNPKIFYCAGEFVFRSLDRGENPKIISPDITRTPGGSGTALAESPKNADVLWAGTDDGNLWITRDGGQKWTNVADKVGLPGPRWVATIEASKFAEGRAYVVFDAHRSDDDNPYVFRTDDFGQTWTPIREGLPMGSTRCLREDAENENVLYLGTEFSIYASIDRGKSWTKINNNLPTVAVHEIAVHPTAGEIVAGTHGRSLWILDVSALRQMTPQRLEAAAHLFKPHTATRYRTLPSTGRTNRRFVGTNPTTGVPLYYSLTGKAEQVEFKVVDISGKTLRAFQGSTTPGLHRFTWDMTQTAPPDGKGGFFGGGKKGGGGGGMKGGFGTFRALVPPGDYRAVLTVDGKEYSQVFRVEVAPPLEAGRAGEEEWLEIREGD